MSAAQASGASAAASATRPLIAVVKFVLLRFIPQLDSGIFEEFLIAIKRSAGAESAV